MSPSAVPPNAAMTARPVARAEEVKAFRHARARGHAEIAFGIDERVLVLVDRDVELARDEDFKAIEGPRLPVLVGEPEHGLAPQDTLHVHAERLLQVFLDEAEHLVRLVDFHAPVWQAIVVAQSGHGTDVNPGNGGRAEVERNPVGLPMGERVQDALPARWGGHTAIPRH